MIRQKKAGETRGCRGGREHVAHKARMGDGRRDFREEIGARVVPMVHGSR